MARRFLSVVLGALLCATVSGCGESTSLDTAQAAQPVVVSPQPNLQSVELAANDVVFPGAPDPAGMMFEARPSLQVMPNASEAMPLDKVEAFAATTGPVSYNATQIRKAYGLDKLPNGGKGQIIAIVDAYGSPTVRADLATFSTNQGLPAANMTIAYQGSTPIATDAGWALETALDVQWAHAVAPNATILLVVARSASLGDLLTCVDYAVSQGAGQVSMSWGAGEFASQASYDSHFNKAGVTFLASSGDSGKAVNWPAVSSYVTSVGGTSLRLDKTTGAVASEGAWSGSGGGRSAYSAIPAYQNAVAGVKTVCAGRRGGPDVSYNADPSTGYMVYTSTPYNGQKGWFVLGGTSAGAPQWAALTAVINSQRVTAKLARLSGLNSKIYTLPAANFKDITLGSNGFPATSGFDLVTGLGSPVSLTLYTSTSK